MKRCLICLCVLWTLVFTSGRAQHSAMFTQYQFNMLPLNPAYAGSRDVLSVLGLGRIQWAGFEGAPRTLTFSAHAPTRNPKNNFGLTLLNDRTGVTHHNMIAGTYAYRIPLGKMRLAFGISGGISFLQDKFSELSTISPNDPSFNGDSQVFAVPRVGAGLWLDGSRFFVGFSAPQIVQWQPPAYQAYADRLFAYKPISLAGGYVFKLNPDLVFRPTVLVKYLKNSPVELDVNAHFILKNTLWLGAGYRTGDGIAAMLEVQASPQLKFGYAFDYALSTLRRYQNGTHEFMLRYEFGYKIKAMSPRYF